MDIINKYFSLAVQILDASETNLSYQDIVNKIIELNPEWLPKEFYDPTSSYQTGQRLFHAKYDFDGCFTIEDVRSNVLFVTFDSGRKTTLLHRRDLHPQFPTSLSGYLLEKLRMYNFKHTKLRVLPQTIWNDKQAAISTSPPQHPKGSDRSSSNDEQLLKQMCEKYGMRCFYRIDHIDNLAGILREGLFCHDQRKWQTDISDQEVQSGRHHKRIPCAPWLTLHDCVPIFIAPKPPMLSARREQQSDIVYLHLSPELLLLPDAVFTDGNARNNSTEFYCDLADFDKLDWDILKAEYWNSSDETVHKENKRRRSAEILIPEHVPPSYIQSVSVLNKETFHRVASILMDVDHRALPVHINPDLYYPMPFSSQVKESKARYSTDPECPEDPPNWEQWVQPPPEDYWS